METRRCCQHTGLFTHPRGFLSEFVIPPQGRDITSPLYYSCSDTCLESGLRRVLHQLCKQRTRRDGYDCGARHTYFRDILRTVSGLDYEFYKIDRFLSTHKRTSATNSRDENTYEMSPIDSMSNLDFAAKSLLKLIFSLKNELTVQLKVRCNDGLGSVYQTNKLVCGLEQKLHDLLGKLDNFKRGSGKIFCCKRCSDNMTKVNKSTRRRLKYPTMNCIGNAFDEDLCVKSACRDHLPVGEDQVPSCGQHKTRLKHRNTQEQQPNFQIVKKIPNRKCSIYNNSHLQSFNGNRDNSVIIQPKTSKDSRQNAFKGTYGHLNDFMVQKRCRNIKKKDQLKSYCCVQNKNQEINRGLPRYEINGTVQARSKTPVQPQLNTFGRKRAGKDGSAIYDFPDRKTHAYNNNNSFHREIYTKGTNKQQNGHSRISQPKNEIHEWSKRVIFSTSSSDLSSNKDGDISGSPMFVVKDFKNTLQKKSKHNLNLSSNDRLNTIGKHYNYTNKKQRVKGSQKASKRDNIKLKETLDSFTSQENDVSGENDYTSVKPNAKFKSHFTHPRNQRCYYVYKAYAHLDRANNRPKVQIKSKPKRTNSIAIDKQKQINTGSRPNNSRRYRNQRALSNESKVGNFLKRVRSNLSKIRLFSDQPKRNVYESESSKSRTRYNSRKPLNDYNRTLKRPETEYSRLRSPLRWRTQPHTYRDEASSVDMGTCNVCGSNSTLSQRTHVEDHSISPNDINDSLSCDYPYFFERIPSPYDYASDYSADNDLEHENQSSVTDSPNDPPSCEVCSLRRRPEVSQMPRNEDCGLADEYEVIFEKVDPKIERVRPKKVVRKKQPEESTSRLSTEYSSSTESVRCYNPRKHVKRNRFRNVTVIKKRVLPAEEMPRSKRRRPLKYIRVGSEKFQESTEKVVDYDSYQPAERQFTSQPPVKDTYSRGTSTEILPLFTKRTSTSDLIKLIKAIGTSTDLVTTRDAGIDPIPLKQKTHPVVPTVKSQFTNTTKVNVHSTGTDTIPETAKIPLVNKATDPVFYLDLKDKTTNTAPEKKKHVTHIGTDPRPSLKPQQATKSTDPLNYLGQQVKFTNTDPVITIHAQTETPRKPADISIGTSTAPVITQDQNTSYEKVKTSNRGNNPLAVQKADKGLQFNTVEHKPAAKTAFTETFTLPRIGITTQTSFIDKPIVKPTVYQVQTQTEPVLPTSPPPIVKQWKQSISEEIIVVEAEEPSSASPSELSMHLVFEKCQDDVYKIRTNSCKPKCFACCSHGQRVLVCENIRSKQMVLNSLSDCNESSMTQKDKSDLEASLTKIKGPIMSKFICDHDQQTVGKVQNSNWTIKQKFREECGKIEQDNQINKESRTQLNILQLESDENIKSHIGSCVFESSNTTINLCDWKNIVQEIKLNN